MLPGIKNNFFFRRSELKNYEKCGKFIFLNICKMNYPSFVVKQCFLAEYSLNTLTFLKVEKFLKFLI